MVAVKEALQRNKDKRQFFFRSFALRALELSLVISTVALFLIRTSLNLFVCLRLHRSTFRSTLSGVKSGREYLGKERKRRSKFRCRRRPLEVLIFVVVINYEAVLCRVLVRVLILHVPFKQKEKISMITTRKTHK